MVTCSSSTAAHSSPLRWRVSSLSALPAARRRTSNVNRDLQSPGQLEEKVLGPADAKVTIVEYASMSCPHCAHFDATTFDDFKLKYIDSGKVRYIFREFPLNAPAFAAAMVARCAPADKFFDIVHTYFRTQDKWLDGERRQGRHP